MKYSTTLISRTETCKSVHHLVLKICKILGNVQLSYNKPVHRGSCRHTATAITFWLLL